MSGAPVYRTFADLVDAYEKGKVTDDEYRKYFQSMTGEKFDGYPDFTQSYFRKFTGKTRKRAERSTRRWVVVKSECNSFGDIVMVVSAFVFQSKSEAISMLNDVFESSEKGSFKTSSSCIVVKCAETHYEYKIVAAERHPGS